MVESLQLIRQIAVRAIVTENFKNQVGQEIQRNLQQIDAELQQLEALGGTFKTKLFIDWFDNLDDFFKKKDRKGNKHKKQSGILTNNEELLKQLGKKLSYV